MKFENLKAIIFDLDGTLIDTEKIYAKAWPKAVRELGYEMTHEQYLALRSLGRPYAPAKLKEWYGDDFDYNKCRKLRTNYFNEYVSEHGIELKKGALELLEYLKHSDYVVAIATATDLERATNYLKQVGLFEYIDKIISAAMVEHGKPSPEVYEYACKQLGLRPNECLAVEDAPNGIRSAHDAGLNVIMVPDQSPCTKELEELISLEVKSLDQIIDLI